MGDERLSPGAVLAARAVRAPQWTLLASSTALGVTLLNTAATNVALPTIGADLGG
jgi:hypothetical protein